jgi:transposase
MFVVENPSEGKPSMGKSIQKLSSVTRVGLDLAKKIFQVHAVDANGEMVVARKLARGRLVGFFSELPRCVVAMEACSSAHHWGRQLLALDFEVRLIPPAHVKPYGAPRRRAPPKRKTLRRIGAAFARIASAHSSGSPALRRPSAWRSRHARWAGLPLNLLAAR